MKNNEVKEALSISSGKILLADQYMLGREDMPQNLAKLGALAVDIENETYRVARSAENKIITLVAGDDGSDEELIDSVLHDKDHFEKIGEVQVHTRCLVLHDANVLENSQVMDKYRELRSKREEKAARDFLRESGGIVRYGFEKHGDSLGVFKNPHHSQLALWPI